MEEKFTYGCELEWSDIDRKIDIPTELGSWEGPKMAGHYMGSEIDIVNTQGQWRGVGTDPLCITCPVGGEIHTVPSTIIESQLFRIMRIMDMFPKLGVACPNHGHIHVKVPGLKYDLKTLKNFFEYLKNNEDDLILKCCGYNEEEYKMIMGSDLADWVKEYLIVGDGKHINPELYDKIEKANTIQEALYFLDIIPCCDWDWVADKYIETPNSHRTAVNMYNLLKGDTIEFRIFRASLNPFEIYSCLKFVEAFVHEAIKGKEGRSVNDILNDNHYEFPKLNFDYELAKGWQNTRQTKGRCGPFKKSFSSATVIMEDPIDIALRENGVESGELSGFDQGLLGIIQICENTWQGKTLDELREILKQVEKTNDVVKGC